MSFAFNSAVAGGCLEDGDEYFMQLAPIVAGHLFGYTTPMPLRLTSKAADEAAAWQLEQFVTLEQSEATSPAGDFGQDGISNLIERALGLDPAASGEVFKQLPQGGVSNVGPLANRLVVRFSLCHTLPHEPR